MFHNYKFQMYFVEYKTQLLHETLFLDELHNFHLNSIIIIIIIIIIIVVVVVFVVTACEFFTPALADGLSQESEWQQIFSSRQDSSQYSDRS